MNSGIYLITINYKIYIGSSNNIYKRRASHLYRLRKNTHNNPILQNLFNKYGENLFTFSILENCSVDDLLKREQYWIDLMNPYININREVAKSSTLGKKLSIDRVNSMIEKSSKKCYQYDLEGNFIKEWKSRIIASRDLFINPADIC